MFPYALTGTDTLIVAFSPGLIISLDKLKIPTALLTVKVALTYASA